MVTRMVIRTFTLVALGFAAGVLGGCAGASRPTITYSGSVLDTVHRKNIERFHASVKYDPNQQLLLGSGNKPLTDLQQVEASDDLTSAYNDALIKCGNILAKYEYSANSARLWLLGISTVGALAGGVVAPMLLARSTVHKSAVAAWSGLSGVTNLAQQTVVNEGLDPNSYVTTRAAIVAKMQQYITDYGAAQGDYNKKFAAVAGLEGACVAYDIAKAAQEVNTFTPSPPPSAAKTVPGAPVLSSLNVTASTIVVAFSPPASNGGADISEYEVSATPSAGGASITKKGTASPITVDGLNSKTSYAISLVAKNAIGSSAPVTGSARTD